LREQLRSEEAIISMLGAEVIKGRHQQRRRTGGRGISCFAFCRGGVVCAAWGTPCARRRGVGERASLCCAFLGWSNCYIPYQSCCSGILPCGLQIYVTKVNNMVLYILFNIMLFYTCKQT
jgi:hypothetical protein